MSELCNFKESEVYQIYQKRNKLLDECNLLSNVLYQKRLERMEQINSIRNKLRMQISQIKEKINEIESIHQYKRYELCQKFGHAYNTESDIENYTGDHSSRNGLGCIVRYNSVCKFCKHESSGTYSTYDRCVKFVESDELSDEQISLKKAQEVEIEKIHKELGQLENKDLELQFELEKLCNLFGHLIPPFEAPLRNDEEICKCCGKIINYRE